MGSQSARAQKARAENAERTDHELVEAILANQPGAFDELHDRHSQRIYRFAVKRLRDAAEAEDVTQEVFLQVHRCLDSFEGRSTLLTWMFGIAHNQVCRRFRRKSFATVELDASEGQELAAADVPVDRQVDATRVLRQCQSVLEQNVSAIQREVFELRYGENKPTRSIAEELGKSNQAIKISLFRTRNTIAERTPELEFLLSA